MIYRVYKKNMLLQWLYSIPARNPNWAGTDKLIGGLQAQRWYYHGYLYRPGVCLCVCGHVAIFLTACLCVRGSSYVSARMHVLCVYIKREGVVTESMVQIKKGWGWGGGDVRRSNDKKAEGSQGNLLLPGPWCGGPCLILCCAWAPA